MNKNEKTYRNMTVEERIKEHKFKRRLAKTQIEQAKNKLNNHLRTHTPKDITFKSIIKELENEENRIRK